MAFAQLPREVAERERLALGRAPLTEVIAPAGFGKTTLIQTWRRQVNSSAYGTFDPFFRTNARDVGLTLVDCGRELGVAEDTLVAVIGLLASDGRGLGGEFVSRLARALREIDGPFVCFLDDLHGLAEEVSQDVGRLISSVADERHQFVVASRVALSWPTERWRVTGFATVVSADQLRLTSEEIARLLPAESAHLAAAAQRATGGWPAAVEVLRWRLASRPNLDLDLETEVLDLVDYVLDEVLPALPETDMRVLTRTSILQPFPDSVAVAVSGERAAGRILFEVQRRTSLSSQSDAGYYSYHAVLRAALRRQLAHCEPELEQQLQLRAAEAWLDEPDTFTTLSNAVDHLIEGRSWPEVIELLRRRLAEIDQHARLDRFVDWLDAVPGRQWRDDIEMVLLYSYANLRIGRPAQAIESLHDPLIGQNDHAAAVAKLIYAWTTGWTADPQEALLLCEQAAPVLAALDEMAERSGIPQFPGVRRFALAAEIAIGQANAILGRSDEAVESLQRSLQHRSDITAMQQSVICGALSHARAMQGEVDEARARAEEALQLAADAGLVNHHIRTVPAQLGLALVATMTGDRDAALTILNDAAECCRPLRAANLLAACGQIAALCGVSHSYLADVDPPLTAAMVPIVEQFTVAAAARNRSRLGDHAGAERLLRTTSPHEAMLGAWVEILLHRAERRSVRRWLARLDQPGSRHGRILRLVSEAAAAESASETSRRAAEAAELASEGQLVGVLMNAPAQLWSMLDTERSHHPMIIETMTKLDGPAVLAKQLTARELEVLRLLPYVSTAGELAARLFVSENTANWHRRNIYRKLGVHRRREAVARGVELGLIAPGFYV